MGTSQQGGHATCGVEGCVMVTRRSPTQAVVAVSKHPLSGLRYVKLRPSVRCS